MVDCTFTVIDSESWGTTTRGHPASPWCHDYIGRLLYHRHAQQGAFYLCSWGCATACTHPCRLERPRDPPDFEAYRPFQAGQPLEVFWAAATLVWPSPLPAATCGHRLPSDTFGGVSQDFRFASFTSATAATATSLTSCPTSSRSTCTRPPDSPGPSSPSRPTLPTTLTLPTTGDKRKKKAVKHRTAPAARREPLLADRDTSDDDETGRPRPLLGAGNLGKGPPLTTRWGGKYKLFHDGGGLCSRGRWLPSCRTPLAAPAVALRAIIKKHLALIPDRKRLLFAWHVDGSSFLLSPTRCSTLRGPNLLASCCRSRPPWTSRSTDH